MNVLVVDIGGTHIKFRTQKNADVERIKSGPKMTPEKMVTQIHSVLKDLKYDRVSIGFPGPVVHNLPLREPFNLGKGWTRFKFSEAFGHKPLRMINDAGMQALGSYRGGRMLFLGLGTGLGSALVVEGIVQSMELAHLPWRKGKTYEEFLGEKALEKDGHKAWEKSVRKAITELQAAMETDYIVLGGGNNKLVDPLPANVELGSNNNAFKGGFMLWEPAHQQSR